MNRPERLLELRQVTKSFGGVRALRGADFCVSAPGAVHALLGENGSGKSTLLNILSGLVQPDSGEISVDGRKVTIDSPAAALRHGIVYVTQETAVATDLTIAENVLMGRLPRLRGVVSQRLTLERAAELIARLGMRQDPRQLVRELRPDERQMVEIARALSMNPRLLILDEPTSTLIDSEVDAVLGAIRLLKQQSVATILVSHRLVEIFAVADELTVLRDGSTVAAGRCQDFTAQMIVNAMLGEAGASAQEAKPYRSPAARNGGSVPALELQDVSGRGFSEVSLELRAGEIVGLAGLVGSGRGDVLRAIFGVTPPTGGSMLAGGEEFRPTSPAAAIKAGFAYVPPDRKTDGLVLTMSVRENVAMVATAQSRSGLTGRGKSGVPFNDILGQLRVRASALDAPAGTLSGGNQQKIALAKWLATDMKVMLLGEPTRGVDVVARDQIHQILREIAGRGVAVLVSSSENAELLAVCDRIVVMFAGHVVAEVERDDVDEPALVALCGRHDQALV